MSSSKYLAKGQPRYVSQQESVGDEATRDRTSAIFYEFLDLKGSDDGELDETQRMRIHDSASSCIREIRGREACSPYQLDNATVVAKDIVGWGEDFNSGIDGPLNQVIDSALEDTDGQPSVDSVIQHISDVVMRMFECDENGEAQNVSPGKLVAVFHYGYLVCKSLVKRVLSTNRFLRFLMELGSFLISALLKAKFNELLSKFGGLPKLGGANVLALPAGLGNVLLLAGAATLGGWWLYRMLSNK